MVATPICPDQLARGNGASLAIALASLERRLVVVRDFDFVGIAGLPSETKAILLIDANTVLTPPGTGQALQSVPRRNRQLAKIGDSIELRQLAPKQ